MTLMAWNTTLPVTKKGTSSWKNEQMVENGKRIVEPNGKSSTASDLEIIMEDTTALTMSATIKKKFDNVSNYYILRMKGVIFVV